MYRALVLVTVFLAASLAASDDDMKKCFKIFHPRSHHCCKRDLPPRPPKMDDMKECMQIQGKPNCERELCMAMKKGVATSDGKINKDALLEVVDKDFADLPDLQKLIKDNCVNGDISKYGKPDFCDLLKLKVCMDTQFVASCPEWDDEGDCSGMKELADECTEKFA